MKKVELPANHKRSLSSSVYLIEKMADEVEALLNNHKDLVAQTIKRDISEEERLSILNSIAEIKDEIRRLSEFYDLKKQEVSESQFLESRKTKAWEILHNSSVSRMDAFGKFPEELKEIYTADIKRLLELVDKL